MTSPYRSEIAVGGESLDPVVVRIRHVYGARRIHSNSPREFEFPLTAPEGAPLGQEGPVRTELLDADVVASIRNVDIPCLIKCKARGVIKLSVTAPEGAPLGQKGSSAVELLDAMVCSISDVYVPVAINGDTRWEVELPVSATLTAPTRDELVTGLDAGAVRTGFSIVAGLITPTTMTGICREVDALVAASLWPIRGTGACACGIADPTSIAYTTCSATAITAARLAAAGGDAGRRALA